MNKDPFKEYIKQSEPNKKDKGYACIKFYIEAYQKMWEDEELE